MTASRIARSLVATGIYTEQRKGVQKIFSSSITGQELYEKMHSFLINPIHTRIYVDNTMKLPDSAIQSGLSALSEYTFLNPPNRPVFAIAHLNRNASYKFNDFSKVNGDTEIELWRYNPRILAIDRRADPLSLALSMAEHTDERIQFELDKMMNKFWKVY